MPEINQAGLDLIKSFEGCSLTAYPDPSSGGEPITIGVGHTGLVNGESVHLGMTITQATADDLLQADLRNSESAVNDLTAIDLTPNQFAALVSFQFNTGALGSSPGMGLINQRQFEAAWDDHFCLYINKGTPAEAGLIRRRAAEKALFFS